MKGGGPPSTPLPPQDNTVANETTKAKSVTTTVEAVSTVRHFSPRSHEDRNFSDTRPGPPSRPQHLYPPVSYVPSKLRAFVVNQPAANPKNDPTRMVPLKAPTSRPDLDHLTEGHGQPTHLQFH